MGMMAEENAKIAKVQKVDAQAEAIVQEDYDIGDQAKAKEEQNKEIPMEVATFFIQEPPKAAKAANDKKKAAAAALFASMMAEEDAKIAKVQKVKGEAQALVKEHHDLTDEAKARKEQTEQNTGSPMMTRDMLTLLQQAAKATKRPSMRQAEKANNKDMIKAEKAIKKIDNAHAGTTRAEKKANNGLLKANKVIEKRDNTRAALKRATKQTKKAKEKVDKKAAVAALFASMMAEEDAKIAKVQKVKGEAQALVQEHHDLTDEAKARKEQTEQNTGSPMMTRDMLTLLQQAAKATKRPSMRQAEKANNKDMIKAEKAIKKIDNAHAGTSRAEKKANNGLLKANKV